MDAVEQARSWIAGDPDPDTRRELLELIESGDEDALRVAMGEPLTFGTAGIRGEVGAGPGRMNRATVIKTTAGLAAYLKADGRDDRPVIVGFDARPTSRTFAEDTAGVLCAAGFEVRYFPEVTPTPVVAYAARITSAAAAVVITASHNPPADNGYKVYGANAAQIIPPEDTGIAAAIRSTPDASAVARIESAFSGGSERVTPLDSDVVERYYLEVDAVRPSPQTSDLKVVYTPMHGVGGTILTTLFERAGHTGLVPVPEQFDPDGMFPTVAFPNPEEKGALDLAYGLAEDLDADAVIANDPDADRLAAAVPYEGGWRPLSGNEMGALLGDYVLRYWRADAKPIVANSIVSSPILGRIAENAGAHYERTLTGFKWIRNATLALEQEGVGQFAFGYEEALGYTVGPVVRDKDGISAALVFCDLVAEERAAGRSIIERLHRIWDKAGLWVSAQKSIVRPGSAGQRLIADAVARLGDEPPPSVAGREVSEITDYRTGAEARPLWLGAQQLIELEFGEAGRLLVRPSGTEPKLKIYVDLVGDPGSDPDLAHSSLLEEANQVATAMEDWLAI